MYKTLIADDDFLVRTYLKSLQAWSRHGYEVTADVRDGEEALQTLAGQDFDVLITDISMPLMDGIELIRQIRQHDQELYIIILSCHDEFQYVKEAMKLGANEYILKNTLDEQMLEELLLNTKKNLTSRDAQRISEAKEKELIQIGTHSLKYRFFNQILSGSLSPDEREQKRKEAGIEGIYTSSAIINLFIPAWSQVSSGLSPVEQEQYSQMFISGLTGHLREQYGAENRDVEIIWLGEGIFCCFLDLSSMRSNQAMRQQLTSVTSAAWQYCRKEPYTYRLSVSNISNGSDGLSLAYHQAREVMKLHFYEDSDILCYDIQKGVTGQLPEPAVLLEQQMEQLCSTGDTEALQASFRLALDACTAAQTDPRLLIQWLKRLDHTAGVRRTPEAYTQIHCIGDLYNIEAEYAAWHTQKFTQPLPEQTSNAVRQAVHYIQEHYQKPISLSDAAGYVHLNPAYFSYLFKQETGIGFANFLLEHRITCACNLMDNTNEKIKDIASRCGFNDYHYFSKAFKKIKGCSPARYRQNNE